MKRLLIAVAIAAGVIIIGLSGVRYAYTSIRTLNSINADVNELVIEGNEYCNNPDFKLNCLAVKSEIHADATERAKLIGKEQ
ncbi:hypothetical protein MLJ13_001279 [Klebsiella pneumoniae]|nr:hypothetical protein [Klebsiella pneumoniae]EJD3766328.1 hypothetical protein [Klebsiella pneumoniae]